MKTLTLQQRERRLVTAGVVLIAVALLVTRGGPSWWRWVRVARASASETVAEAAQVERSVTSLPVTLDTLEKFKQRFVALAPAFLPGENATQAAGALAALVSHAAQEAGLQLGALSVLDDSADAGFVKTVAVRIDARGDVRGLLRFLGILERGPAILAVKEIVISQTSPAAPASQAEQLRARMRVEGLVFVADTAGGR